MVEGWRMFEQPLAIFGQFDDGWPSLGAYLHQVADTLEFGGTVNELTPHLTPEGELRWLSPGEAWAEGLLPAPTTRTR